MQILLKMGVSVCSPNAFLAMFIILVVISTRNSHAEGGNHSTAPTKMVKGTIKTIKTEDGEIIDCVDIYKQPALNHPLLKNHTIQLEPSSPPNEKTKMNGNPQREVLIANWAKNGGCPNGTVPINRSPLYVDMLRNFAKLRGSSQGYSNQGPSHEYATVYEQHGNTDIRGGQGRFNVWNPIVAATHSHEFSASQLWLESGRGDSKNTVEAGWMVYPLKYGHTRTVFFTYWTNDGYRSGRMCYNLDCEGFVRVSPSFSPGDQIPSISVPNGNQVEIDIKIYKDTDTRKEGNWWVEYNGARIGYWPAALFAGKGLGTGADKIQWGGEVVDSRSQRHHTSTQMGSGAFPSAGFGLASYVSHLKYKIPGNTWIDPQSLRSYISNDNCYDVTYRFPTSRDDSRGVHILFGGPGFSPRCR